uniref:(northern house mosquito) hypothetical protein n=1 Tax=Culex pipiens TaxID=7175 RepID=A0A8D8BR25_CULPI
MVVVAGVETVTTEECAGSTTKEVRGGTTEGGGITAGVAAAVTIMVGIAAGGTLTIPGMVLRRMEVASMSRIGRNGSSETTSNSSNISSSSSRVTVVEDGRETPEEEDSGMAVGEEVRRMRESRVRWGMEVRRTRDRWNLCRRRRSERNVDLMVISGSGHGRKSWRPTSSPSVRSARS